MVLYQGSCKVLTEGTERKMQLKINRFQTKFKSDLTKLLHVSLLNYLDKY